MISIFNYAHVASLTLHYKMQEVWVPMSNTAGACGKQSHTSNNICFQTDKRVHTNECMPAERMMLKTECSDCRWGRALLAHTQSRHDLTTEMSDSLLDKKKISDSQVK